MSGKDTCKGPWRAVTSAFPRPPRCYTSRGLPKLRGCTSRRAPARQYSLLTKSLCTIRTPGDCANRLVAWMNSLPRSSRPRLDRAPRPGRLAVGLGPRKLLPRLPRNTRRGSVGSWAGPEGPT